MKKITDFLLRFRIPLFIGMLIFAGICFILLPKVNVNKDMTKYLSESSNMKQGLDIMDREFPDTEDEYDIRMMLTGVPENEKTVIKDEIKDITDVESVSYKADDEEYNKGEYTLYEITTHQDYGTDRETALEEELARRYERYSPVVENLSNDVVLAPYLIIAVAVVLLVILFLMSGSWFEPVLILVVIGLAIPVNMGTNFFLPSVSNTTYSISAILQLVLSMDYSIILMNRYRRERKDGNDKIAAMRTALSGTFSSIVSSAFTTFVGLLMLVFMQYRIGADLGIVLAKGVVCSLLCIFTLLPAMIIFSDKLLSKTRKPSLHIPMGWLAAFSHKLRYALPAVFAGIFVLFLLLQRITPISFDGTPTRQIANVFPENNRIVVLYDNKDSDKIPGLEEELKKYPGVSSVVSYETTLGKERTAEDMLDFLDDLESDVDMQVPDMKLLYYDYFKKGEAPNLKVSDLIMFINDDLLTDPHYAEKMEGEIRDNIKDMVRFADPAALKEKRSFSDLRAFLSGDSGSGEMSDEDVKLMYTYYFTKDENYSPGSMTLNEFISFIQNDIRGNETIASYMDGSGENDFSRIDELARYTERNFILTKRSSADMAKILGISVSRAETVYTLYFGNAAADSFTMALPELLEYLQKNVPTNPEYAGSLPADAKAKLEQLSGLVQLSLSGKSLTSDEMARVLGMDAEQAGQLYMLYAADAAGIPEEQASAAEAAAKAAAVQEAYARLLQAASQTTMTLPEFITFLNEKVLTDPAYSAGFDSSKKAQLSQISQIINTVTSGTALDYKNAAKILGMDASSMRNLYALKAGGEAGNKTLSLYDMVKYILENLSGQFDASTRSKLTQLKNIMNLSLNNTSLTYTEMAKILGGGMDMSDLKNLYVMHDAKLNPDFGKMDLVEFLDFLKSDILTDEKMKEKLTPEREKDLNSLTTMVNAVASEKEYNSDELYDLFSSMGDDADRNDMYLLSMMYGSFKDYDPEWKMSMISLFNFISEKVITDERFAGVLDEEDKEKVIENRADMTEYVDQLKGSGHSILLINTRLPYESEETENFVKEIHRLCDERLTGDNYKIGNSPMYHEMQQTFSGEMLFITLLTSGAIFAIVALTFRNLLIPLFLVLIVLCGVFITVAVSGLRGVSINYLAEIIVQCILMGASIDYGILFTSCYRDGRKNAGIRESLKAAYDGTIHTVLTSGLIMVLVTGIIGFTSTDPAVGPICLTLSVGTASAILLILFVYPGMLAAFDRWVIKRNLTSPYKTSQISCPPDHPQFPHR